MRTVLPVLLLGLAGLLVGGAWSLRKQGAGTVAVAVTAGLAVLAAVAGVAWLWPAEG